MRCSRCKKELPSAKFTRNRSRARGYACYCKKCTTEYMKEYEASHPKYVAKRNKRKKEYRSTLDYKYKYLLDRGRHSCTLTFDEYKKIVASGRCYYNPEHKLPAGGHGLDRINNNKGYTKSNVVPCCYQCNRIRSNIYTHKDFKIIAPFLDVNHTKKAIGAAKLMCAILNGADK